VNVASRLLEVAKERQWSVVVSEDLRAVDGDHRDAGGARGRGRRLPDRRLSFGSP